MATFFFGWLEMQTHRLDDTGQLAHLATKDPELQTAGSFRDFATRLSRLRAAWLEAWAGQPVPPAPDYHAALKDSWKECQATRRLCFACGKKRHPERKVATTPLALCPKCKTTRRKAKAGQ